MYILDLSNRGGRSGVGTNWFRSANVDDLRVLRFCVLEFIDRNFDIS